MKYVFPLICLLAMTACGSSDGASQSGGENETAIQPDTLASDSETSGALDIVAADEDPPLEADTYVSGLEKVGVQSIYKVKLLKSDPIPKYTDYYTWTLQVLDMDDEPVPGAALEAEPTMPAHGHGTFPLVTTATETEPGTYELLDMDLFMPGVWNVAIRISGLDDMEDEVAYDFELEG